MKFLRMFSNYILAFAMFAVLVVELAKGRGIDNEMLFLWISVWGVMLSGKLNNMN